MFGKVLVSLGVVAVAAVAVTVGIKIKRRQEDMEAMQGELCAEGNDGKACIRIGTDDREIQRNIERLKYALAKAEIGTPEYDNLSNELKELYEIKRKHKDSRFYVEPKVIAILGVIGVIGFFAICLSQEDPSAIKIAQFILKLFRL